MPTMMKAAVFVAPGRIELADKPIPDVGPNDALIRITTTTICGTDVHILKGEYPVAKGLTVGHEPVGIIEKLGSAVVGYQEGQPVLVRRRRAGRISCKYFSIQGVRVLGALTSIHRLFLTSSGSNLSRQRSP
jgi:threonine dehydrogenase-like Zn-dependent dehydrogenase